MIVVCQWLLILLVVQNPNHVLCPQAGIDLGIVPIREYFSLAAE
jgi:hypothetical protein